VWIIARKKVVKLSLVLAMVSGSDVMAAESGDIVRIWGDLSSTYRERESGDSDATLRNLRNTGTINASSYIWRPWFALINGSLSLSLDETDTSGQETVKDEYSTGDVQFDLFPTSRFPFRAYLIESRNEIDNRSFDQIVKSTEYGFSQQYRNEDGTGNYLADYENNEQDRGGQEKFQSESLLLSASNRSITCFPLPVSRLIFSNRAAKSTSSSYPVSCPGIFSKTRI
jgi:hypothetical protein